MPWTCVVVSVVAPMADEPVVPSRYVSPAFSGFALVIVPLEVEAFTRKSHDSPVLFVSHVHHTCHLPPCAYSTNTPTPSPGVAVIVLFVSTSTRMGATDVGGVELVEL